MNSLLVEGSSEEIARAELLALLRPYVRLSPSISRHAWAGLMNAAEAEKTKVSEGRFSQVAEAEVDLVGSDNLRMVLDDFDRHTNADAQIAEMADDLTSLLKATLDLWAIIGEANSESV